MDEPTKLIADEADTRAEGIADALARAEAAVRALAEALADLRREIGAPKG